MKKFLCALLVFILGVSAGGALVWLFEEHRYRPEPDIVNNVVDIEGQLQGIGELNTYAYAYTEQKVSEKPPKELLGFELPFTSSRITFTYSGKIKAGIDITQAKVSVVEKNVTVIVPKSRITSHELYEDSLVINEEKLSTFNKVGLEDFNKSIESLKKAAEESALSSGLLDNANDNAEDMIKQIVKEIDPETENVMVIFSAK